MTRRELNVSCKELAFRTRIWVFLKLTEPSNVNHLLSGGGLSPPGKNQNRNRYVLLSFEVDLLIWQSFIEIGEMAFSTTARCSRGHTLNIRP